MGAVNIPTGCRLPDFLLIGVEKSASTWLHAQLRSHPQIWMPRQETPFFEDPDYGNGSLADLDAVCRRAPPGRLVGIKRPTDFTRAECAARIAQDLPWAKLIVMLRNPLQRAISAFHHHMYVGLLDVENADIGLRRLLDGTAADKLHVLETGLYARALRRYLEYFPRQQIHLAIESTAAANPVSHLDAVLTFLGIETGFAWKNAHDRVNQVNYGPVSLRLMNALHRRKFRIDTEALRLHPRPDLAGYTASLLVAGLHRVFALSATSRYMTMVSQQTRRRLLDYYARDIADLEALTGFDLALWTAL